MAEAEKLEDVVWADTPFPLTKRHVVLAGWRGSTAHNTYIPSEDPESTDDKDVMAIVVPPPGYYLGLDYWKWDRWDESEGITWPWDTKIYEAKKFIRLLCEQNPNVLSMLYLRQQDYLHVDWLGAALITARNLFRVRDRAHKAFTGYAHGQMEKLTSVVCRGHLGAKRKALIEKHGYDTRRAAHTVRLLYMGIGYQKLGTLTVHLAGPMQTRILAIKRGEWELARILAEAEILFREAETAHEHSCLPEELDHGRIEELTETLITRHLQNQKWPGL